MVSNKETREVGVQVVHCGIMLTALSRLPNSDNGIV